MFKSLKFIHRQFAGILEDSMHNVSQTNTGTEGNKVSHFSIDHPKTLFNPTQSSQV